MPDNLTDLLLYALLVRIICGVLFAPDWADQTVRAAYWWISAKVGVWVR